MTYRHHGRLESGAVSDHFVNSLQLHIALSLEKGDQAASTKLAETA